VNLDELKNRSILVVDDNEFNLEIIQRHLQKHGVNVFLAKNGEEALNSINLQSPDLILLDIIMPKMDGLEFGNYLKNQDSTKNIPIIYISALTNPYHKKKGIEAGAIDYITKPVEIQDLLSKIHKHLAGKPVVEKMEKKITDLKKAPIHKN